MPPIVGLYPTRPHIDAGMRTEPPPSDAVAIGVRPAARAADEPPLEPPGLRSRFHGLRVVPNTKFEVKPIQPNSGVFDFPMGIAPAARNRAVWTPSSDAGGASAKSFEPYVVLMPAQSARSLTRNGIPANGPCRVERAASSRASSARSATTLPISPSCASIRRSASVTNSVGCTRPSRTAALNSAIMRTLSRDVFDARQNA